MLVKVLIAAVFALCVFTGCGGGTAGVPEPSPTPIAVCTALVPLIPGNLISPAAGATGVSTAVGSVSFSVADARLLAGSLTLSPSPTAGGAPVQGGAISGTAADATASVPTLSGRTTYSVAVSANFPGDPCTHTSLLGTFTTGQ